MGLPAARKDINRSCGGTAVTARDFRDHHSHSNHLADLTSGKHSRLSNSAPAELGSSLCGACTKHHETRQHASDATAAGDAVPEASRSLEPQQPQLSTTDSLASAASHHSLASSDSADELQDASGLRTIRELQRGSSGVIVLAEGQGSAPVAVKLMPRDPQSSPALQSEILTQRSCLMHPHVIQFKEAFLMPSQLGIVMEYAAGGDLREYLETYTGADGTAGLPEADARWFFQQLVLGLDFCHSLGIAHQDIKLENALLDRRSARALLKLCDFGYSVRNEAAPGGPVPCHKSVGTPDYMAPELLLSPTSYDGKAADVWACGVLLYTLLTGSFPFWRHEDDGSAAHDPASRLRCMCYRIVGADYDVPSYLSGDCRRLLARMLEPHAEDRATVTEVMESAWFGEALPHGCRTLNSQLLRQSPVRRAAACRQSDSDILRMTRQLSV